MRCLLGFGKGSNDSVLKCRICCRNLESRGMESSFFLNLVVQKVHLKLLPTTHYWKPHSRVEDYELKVDITRQALARGESACLAQEEKMISGASYDGASGCPNPAS
jgi:hypothetical protein